MRPTPDPTDAPEPAMRAPDGPTAPQFPFGCLRGSLPLFIAFALLLALVLLYASGRPGASSTARFSFDRRHWDLSREYRYGMIDDLLDQHLEVGMSRAAVLELLGPTDHVSLDPASPAAASTRRIEDYELARPGDGYGDHPRFLRIEYEHERATKFENCWGI